MPDELEKLVQDDIRSINDKFLKQYIKKHDNFCIYPFIHLDILTNVDGSMSAGPLCCSANGLNPSHVLKLEKETLLGDFGNPKFEELRQQIRKNKLPDACHQQCPKNQKVTHRTVMNDYYKEQVQFKTIIENPRLIRLNWKFGNHCNLACRMCAPSISSHFNKVLSSSSESLKLNLEKFNLYPSKRGDKINRTNDVTLKKLKNMLPHLQYLQTSGGEPFLSNELDNFLKTAIETKDCEHIELEITTNGTKFIKEKLDLISKFKYIRFVISIDGTDSIYDYIRYPFKYSILRKRLEYLAEYIKEYDLGNKTEVSIICMGMIYNLFEYGKLEKLFNEIISPMDLVYSEFFMDPQLTGFFTLDEMAYHYHILNLKFAPSYLIAEALDYYKKYSDEDPEEKLWYIKLKHIHEECQGMAYQPLIKEYTQTFDGMYNQNYQKLLHPSIIKFLS